MKKQWLLIGCITIVIAIGAIFLSNKSAFDDISATPFRCSMFGDCASVVSSIVSSIKTPLCVRKGCVEAEVVLSDEDRMKGLSGRKELPSDKGMFFVFDGPDRHGIWMKDMFFSIDVLWFDSRLRLVDLISDISPDSYPKIFSPSKNAVYALEVPAGFVDKYNIHIGDILKLQKTSR